MPTISTWAVMIGSSASASKPPPRATMRAAFDAAADDGRLLDGHRHQVVRPLTRKVEPTPKRQRVDADDVLDHLVGHARVEAAVIQRDQVVERQQGAVTQMLSPRLDR